MSAPTARHDLGSMWLDVAWAGSFCSCSQFSKGIPVRYSSERPCYASLDAHAEKSPGVPCTGLRGSEPKSNKGEMETD